MRNIIELIDRLNKNHSLSKDEYQTLIENQNEDTIAYAGDLADKARKEIYGNSIYTRGLIEIGNYCVNDCFYCGIRKSNNQCNRYRLSEEQILNCADEGHQLGFRTFVLQGGEGIFSVDEICRIVSAIKKTYSDVAVTLSLGECTRTDYEKMYNAGADRYLLRHETANKEHYQKIHPKEMSFENRMKCLQDLKEIGCQVGCGFMVDPLGRELGIKAGANVVMPNLSPVSERKKYSLYDNKICTGEESAQCKDCLSRRMESIGYKIVVDRGDIKLSK